MNKFKLDFYSSMRQLNMTYSSSMRQLNTIYSKSRSFELEKVSYLPLYSIFLNFDIAQNSKLLGYEYINP